MVLREQAEVAPGQLDVLVDHPGEPGDLLDGAGVHALVLAHQQPGALVRQVAEDTLGFVGPQLIEIGLLRLQRGGDDRRLELLRHAIAVALDRRYRVAEPLRDAAHRNAHRERPLDQDAIGVAGDLRPRGSFVADRHSREH